MYNNYPNQFQNPFIPQLNLQQNMQSQKMDIIHVNGENGAKAYQLAPNSNVLLLDDTAPIIWLKQTDGAGYPSLTPYSITPYKPEPPIDVKSLEERILKLEAKINAEPNVTAVTDESHSKPTKSTESKTSNVFF